MEFVAIDSEGVATMIRNNQSSPLEAVRDPFIVDNYQSVVYYVDSNNNLMSVNLNIPDSDEVSEYYML